MAISRNRLGDAGINEFSSNSNRTVEYLPALQERPGSLIYQQMSKGDPIIGMILRVHKNPIRSAAWNIPYPSDVTEIEIKAIDIIKDRLFGKTGSGFDVLLGKILSMLEYGFSIFEQYYEAVKIDGNVYLLPVIEQRMQVSIEDIFPDKRMVRQIRATGPMVEIPLDNLVFFSLNQQGDDMRGESLLRNLHRDWNAKKTYQEWLGIGIQRSVSGIPSMEVPKGVKVDSPEYVAVKQLLERICQQENGYMITQEGYKFDIHESKFNAEQIQKAIELSNSQMALSVLAQFIMLGQQGNTGAFALSRDQSDFFLDGLQYIVDLIASTINDSVIEPYIKINFGEAIDPSRINLFGMNLNKKAGVELSQVLASLTTSGFIKPTLNDEIQLRNNLEMPELTDEEVEERKLIPTQPKAPTPTPAFQFAEPTQKDKDRQEYIANTEKEMQDFMTANLMLIKDKLIADIESTLNKGTVEIQGLKNIEVSSSKYLKGLQMKLAGIANDAWARAKKSAKTNNVKFADIDPKELADKTLKSYVLNQATSISDKQTAGMLNRAILTASTNSLKNLSIKQTISNVSKSVDDYISSSGILVDGTLMVVGTSNFGEQQFYKEIEDQLWGYRFVAVDDDRTTEICSWYNGKTFSVNSTECSEASPPLHPGCRSFLDPIYKNTDKPNIDNVIPPPTIRVGKTFF